MDAKKSIETEKATLPLISRCKIHNLEQLSWYLHSGGRNVNSRGKA